MTSKYFIEDQQDVGERLKTLSPTGERTGYYAELMVDSNNNEKWEKYLLELGDDHKEGIGLRKYPYPSILEAIDIALTTNYDDEADGAAAFLLEYEKDGEFRELLIERLEQSANEITLTRFEIIYHRAELYSKLNRRPTKGKHISQIKRDYEYFVDLANRANTLKKKLEG